MSDAATIALIDACWLRGDTIYETKAAAKRKGHPLESAVVQHRFAALSHGAEPTA